MVDVVAPPATKTVRVNSYVEWGAVIAGAVIASALSFVLLTAGTAVGLSLISRIHRILTANWPPPWLLSGF